MNDIKIISNNEECSDIGKIWKRNCPKCNCEIVYPSQSNYCRGKRTNAKCKWCAHDGQLNGRIQSQEEKDKRSNSLRGKKRSLNVRKKYSINKLGIKNPKYGDHTLKSEEHKRKIRLSCIKVIRERLAKVGKIMAPRFNLNACKAIEDYGKLHGYNFQHAMNGGEFYIKELGYWVDGYDKSKNVVIEYDENNHWHRKNQLKDVARRNEIVYHLGCCLIVLKEEIGGSYLPKYFC